MNIYLFMFFTVFVFRTLKTSRACAPRQMASFSHSPSPIVEEPMEELPKHVDPNDFSHFFVSHKHFETSEVASFVLSPQSGQLVLPHQAGQFLGLSVRIGKKLVLRNYSVSSAPNGRNFTISVKREEHGLLSRHMFDTLGVGDKLDIYFPRGDFTLESSTANTKPIVFITAGIGIAPSIAMVEEISRNPVYHTDPYTSSTAQRRGAATHSVPCCRSCTYLTTTSSTLHRTQRKQQRMHLSSMSRRPLTCATAASRRGTCKIGCPPTAMPKYTSSDPCRSWLA